MAEAEAVFAGNLSLLGRDELLANQAGEPRRHLRLVGDERLDGAAVEDLALDRCALEHGSLGLLEPVEAGRQERLQRRRDDHLAVAGHRQHLADEERVAACCVRDPLAQRLVEGFRNQPLDLRVGQRLEVERDRPGRTALGQLGPGGAEKQEG